MPEAGLSLLGQSASGLNRNAEAASGINIHVTAFSPSFCPSFFRPITNSFRYDDDVSNLRK
jgi:hypothetical protein